MVGGSTSRKSLASTCVGVDGYPKGWVAVVLVDGRFDRALVVPSLGELMGMVPDAAAIGVDIPIGMPDTEPRRADALARTFVGPRRSSVFMALPRAVLTARDIVEARLLCIERMGVSFSAQAWALRTKVLEADEVAHGDPRIREVHPEVSFRAMAGSPLGHPKSSWAGVMLRRQILRDQGINLPDDLGEAGVAGVDDVLDAGAAAWSAARISAGVARSLPPEPRAGSDGLMPAIWY